MPSRRASAFALAAALAVSGVAAFVLAQGTFPPIAGSTPVAREIKPAEIAPFDHAVDGALAAYNADNEAAFLACFSRGAQPPASPHTYQALFNGIYRAEFGEYRSRVLIPAETVPDPDYGQATYDATFERRDHVKLTVDFRLEEGEHKIAQMRLEKMQPKPKKLL